MSEMKFLSKSEIDKKSENKIVPLEVPEWGGWVRVKLLAPETLEKYSSLLDKKEKGKLKNFNGFYWLGAAVIVDEEGHPMFTPLELSRKERDPAGLLRIVRFAQHKSALSKPAIEAMQAEIESPLDGYGTESQSEPEYHPEEP